jgi:serine/threonine-protein kinase
VAIGLLTFRSMIGVRARAEAKARAEAAEQAARAQAELRAVENKTQAAAELPALNNALASHVDSATIIDLLDSEDWWRPYRDEFPLVRLIVGDHVVATRGPSGGVTAESELVKTARSRMIASAPANVGSEPFLLAAARFTALSENDPVLLLGRRAPPAPAPVAQKPAEQLFPLPWAAAGACALGGFGLLISSVRRRRPAAAAALAAAPAEAVVEVEHETTLRFGERRPPANDLGTLEGSRAAQERSQAAPGAESAAMFGRYRLVGRLGEGGMSELFVAEATGAEGFTRRFVLKRLRPELARDKHAVAQFIDEARLQASLVHSNIVPVYDFGVVGGEYFMTQEFIVGRDLARLMERHAARARGGLPSPVAYFAAHETLQALSYAHARRNVDDEPLGIVHRDIAPGNVIVSQAGEVKLSDFGIVKSNDRVSRTQVGVVKGNTNFMSPEQARGQTVDARSDLFALGLVLYYSLSGELLYTGHNDLEVLHRAAGGLLRDDFMRIRDLPDPAPQILERALALDPSERFQSAAEFADELAIHMGGGRAAIAHLMRELFSRDLPHETALPVATAVGYTAGP